MMFSSWWRPALAISRKGSARVTARQKFILLIVAPLRGVTISLHIG